MSAIVLDESGRSSYEVRVLLDAERRLTRSDGAKTGERPGALNSMETVREWIGE